jgi:hypothetical protein
VASQQLEASDAISRAPTTVQVCGNAAFASTMARAAMLRISRQLLQRHLAMPGQPQHQSDLQRSSGGRRETHVPQTKGGVLTAPHDLVARADVYKAGLYQFYLDITEWRKFNPGIPLVWQRVKFDSAAKTQIPKQRGLYVFTVEADGLGLPVHGYIMYVGITGNTSDATLRSRFGQYLREKEKARGRPRVVYMLNKWTADLVFNFMPVPDPTVDLAKIEQSFLDTIKPPVNQVDFSAEIAAPRKAAF